MTNPDGYTALDLVGYTDQGDYDATKSYVANDLVHYDGSIWCCLIDDTVGIEPRNNSVNWEVFIDYSDLSNIKSDFLSLGYINQIPYPYYDGASKTADGITWTVNNDKSITINGTATKITYFYLLFHNANALTPNIPYAMSLGSDVDSSKLRMQITYRADGGTEQVRQSSSKAETEFTINDSNITTIQFRLVVLSDQTIDNITVYPSIRKLTDGKTNRALTEDVAQNTSDIQTLTNNVSANATAIAKCETLVVSVASFSALPQTITNANIEDDMVVVNSVLSNPSAQTGDWTVTTSSGSLTISGSISGTTTATLYLMKSR